MEKSTVYTCKTSEFLFHNKKSAFLWLLVRLSVGFVWLSAGWEKLQNPVWVGDNAGAAVSGFLNGALAKTAGVHPDVLSWYAWFIEHVALPHAAVFSYLVTFGELLIGLGLIFGLFTGVAAFFGSFLNFNFMFSGTTGINPPLVIAEIFLMLAWRVAGHYGLDRYVFSYLRKRKKG